MGHVPHEPQPDGTREATACGISEVPVSPGVLGATFEIMPRRCTTAEAGCTSQDVHPLDTWRIVMQEQLTSAWWALRLAFFLGPFLAGLDKFFHVLVDWDKYLNPVSQRILGSLSHPFMLLVGVIEMIVGLMVITKWPRLGAYIASLWLLLIAI